MIQRLKNLLFQNRNTRQTIVKNTFWLSIGQVGSRFIRAIILIYAARVLGASEYGIFSYVLGVAGFFTIFADLGVSPLMTREIASHPEKRDSYFVNAFWIKIILLFITSLLIVFIAPKFSRIETAAILVPFAAILVFFDNFRDFIFGYFRGVEKMEVESFLTVIMNVVIVIAGFIALHFSKSAGALLFSYIASVTVSSGIAFYLVRDHIKLIFKKFHKKIFQQFFHDSWPVAFAGLFGIFMLNIDLVLLGWWRSAQEIGYYSASQRVVQTLYTLPAILGSAIFPVVARLIKQNDKEKTKSINEKSMSVLYFIAVPLAIGGIVLGKPIIQFLFGKEYLPGTLTFQIFCATLLINFPGSILSNIILAKNQQRVLFKYIAIGAFINVFFDVLFIPPYGITGSAVATFLSQLAYYGPVWISLKKQENFYTLRHLKKIAVSGLIMGIFSFIANRAGLNVIINIIISTLIYITILSTLKEKILSEIKEILLTAKSKN